MGGKGNRGKEMERERKRDKEWAGVKTGKEREREGKRGTERKKGGKRERGGGLITYTICLVSYLRINHVQKNNNKSIVVSPQNQIFYTFYRKFQIIRDNCQKRHEIYPVSICALDA